MKRPIITVAIDSPAAAGAGTQAKLISKEYNLLYLDTGKIYRIIGKLRLEKKNKFNYNSVKNKIANIKIKDLSNKNLLSNELSTRPFFRLHFNLSYFRPGSFFNFCGTFFIASSTP